MKRSNLRNIIRELVSEVLMEDTTLRSLVAKADSEKKANSAVSHLKSGGIDARSAYPSRFGLASGGESAGWGVFVEPSDVVKAARQLSSMSKGLEFDPYVKSSGETE